VLIRRQQDSGAWRNLVGGAYFKLADYCVLSVEEAARLEVYSAWPRCCDHSHIKRKDALGLVADETHRLVGGQDTKIQFPVTMIVPVALGREWKPVPCRNHDGSMILGLRSWGLSPST